MMGKKERAFATLPPVTLEDLVPPDSFYRHLERSLDLGFVRDLVREAYAGIGRPSAGARRCLAPGVLPRADARGGHQPRDERRELGWDRGG